VAVSLLFTDIEGSTRLVQELGDAYPAALEEHRRLVRSSVEETGGSEMDCRGDEFAAVFDAPDEAVTAARRIQELHPGPIRVRIGIHTGDPLRVDGSYVGVDVHRASRICTAGHGGQVLLSESAHAALREPLDLRDLGPHQLRGLETPERIYQLDPEATFPTLRADVAEHGLGARLRAVVADDSVLLREGVARLLDDAGFNVVGQAGDAEDLLLKVRSYTPDVAIVDIRMPPTHSDEGLQAAKQIREQYPDVGVLVLS